jgi:hypothetical protein
MPPKVIDTEWPNIVFLWLRLVLSRPISMWPGAINPVRGAAN